MQHMWLRPKWLVNCVLTALSRCARWAHLWVDQPAVHQTNVHEVKDCNLVCKLKTADAIKADVDVDAGGQLGQEGNCIGEVALQVGLVLGDGAAAALQGVGLYKKVCHQGDEALLAECGV